MFSVEAELFPTGGVGESADEDVLDAAFN